MHIVYLPMHLLCQESNISHIYGGGGVCVCLYIYTHMYMSHECMFLGSLSHHNKDLERWTLKPLACHSSRVLDTPCYSSQANQCQSSILFRRQQENPSLKHEGMPTQRLEKKRVEERAGEGERERKRGRERERAHAYRREREPESALAPPFMCFFLHLSLPYANCGQPGVLFVLPEVSILVLGPSFDLPCLLTIAILDSFSLFYLPNTEKLFHVHVRILSFKGSNQFNIFFSPGLPLVKKIISFINKVSNRTTNFKQHPKNMSFSLQGTGMQQEEVKKHLE